MREPDSTGWERPVFVCGERTWTVRDVLEAARLRGELDAFAERDEASGEVDEAALQAMSEAFRMEHDLITAEETEQWLKLRGISMEEFADYFARTHRKGGSAAPAALPKGNPSLSNHLRVDLMMSGQFDRLAEHLAWRVSSLAASGECAAGPMEPDRLEAAYQEQCAAVLTAEAREQMLDSTRMELTRLAVEIIELDSHDAAREAFHCVNEDGARMADVAAAARYPFRRAGLFLEDVPESSRQRFLSAAPGEVLEPIARGDGFELFRIGRKIDPTLDDDDVRARIERRILDRHFSELTARLIRWIIAPSSSA